MPRLLAALALTTLSLAAAPGCVVITDGDWDSYDSQPRLRLTKAQTVPHETARPLLVTTDNGDVSVTTSTADEVSIVAKLHGPSQERLDQAEITPTRLPDGTLEIAITWPDGKRKNNEGCDFEIRLPDAAPIRITTGNGDITLSNLAGSADLSTSNGDIELTDHRGPVKARSSNGDITLTRVHSADADTSNGEIDIRLSGPGPVNASTSNGEVDVTVSPTFTGTLQASTSNGKITCRAARAQAIGTPSKRRADWKFGDGPVSTISSSNGSIKVRD